MPKRCVESCATLCICRCGELGPGRVGYADSALPRATIRRAPLQVGAHEEEQLLARIAKTPAVILVTANVVMLGVLLYVGRWMTFWYDEWASCSTGPIRRRGQSWRPISTRSSRPGPRVSGAVRAVRAADLPALPDGRLGTAISRPPFSCTASLRVDLASSLVWRPVSRSCSSAAATRCCSSLSRSSTCSPSWAASRR